MARIIRTVVTSNQWRKPLGVYSMKVTETPGWIRYVARQIGKDVRGSLVGKADAALQTHSARRHRGHTSRCKRSFR